MGFFDDEFGGSSPGFFDDIFAPEKDPWERRGLWWVNVETGERIRAEPGVGKPADQVDARLTGLERPAEVAAGLGTAFDTGVGELGRAAARIDAALLDLVGDENMQRLSFLGEGFDPDAIRRKAEEARAQSLADAARLDPQSEGERFAQNVVSSVPTTGAILAAGALNPFVGGAAGGILAGESTYTDAREAGASKGKAALLGGTVGLGSAALERVGIGSVFGKGAGKEVAEQAARRSLLASAGRGALGEGLTEGAQEGLAMGAELAARDFGVGWEDRGGWRRILESAAAGGVMGGPMSAASTMLQNRMIPQEDLPPHDSDSLHSATLGAVAGDVEAEIDAELGDLPDLSAEVSSVVDLSGLELGDPTPLEFRPLRAASSKLASGFGRVREALGMAAAGSTVKTGQTGRVHDVEAFAFDNPEAEARFREGLGGTSEPTVLDKALVTINNMWQGFNREYRHLHKGGGDLASAGSALLAKSLGRKALAEKFEQERQYSEQVAKRGAWAPAHEYMRLLSMAWDNAGRDVLRMYKASVDFLDPRQKTLFARKLALDHAARLLEWKGADWLDANPFNGLRAVDVANELPKIDAAFAADPLVQRARENHNAAMQQARDEMVEAARAAGAKDLADALNQQGDDYLHHKIIDLVEEKRAAHMAKRGGPTSVSLPGRRSHEQQLKGAGEGQTFSLRWDEAIGEVYAQMRVDTATLRARAQFKQKYDILPKLQAAAKQRRREIRDLQAALRDEQRQIRVAQEDPTAAPTSRRYAEIDQEIASLEEEWSGVKWQNYMPEGYAEYQDTDRSYFKTLAVSDRVLAKLLDSEGNLKDDADHQLSRFPQSPDDGWTVEKGRGPRYNRVSGPSQPAVNVGTTDLREVTAVGSYGPPMVMPIPLIETFNDQAQSANTQEGAVSRASAKAMAFWKKSQLFTPFRWPRYVIRNFLTDAQAVLSGNFGQVLDSENWKATWADLNDYRKTGYGSPTFERWLMRSGNFGGMTAHDIVKLGEQNAATVKRMLSEGLDPHSLAGKARRMAGNFAFMRGGMQVAQYGEAFLRYASFRHYLKQLEANGGVPDNYGASIKEEIDALDSNEEKAYWLSNELMGSYDQITESGQTLRKHLIPFWSFSEVNLRRHYRLLRNAYLSGSQKQRAAVLAGLGAKGAVYTAGAAAAASAIAKFHVAEAAMLMWNSAFDEDGDLPEEVRNSSHVFIPGVGSDGEAGYFHRISAVEDVRSWLGLDELVPLIGNAAFDYVHGRMTAEEAAKRVWQGAQEGFAPTEVGKSMLAKMWLGSGGVGGLGGMKTAGELMTGLQTYPDPFNPRPIRDRVEYVARQFEPAGWMYARARRRFADVPTNRKSTPAQEFLRSLWYTAETERAQYYDVLNDLNRFAREQGEGNVVSMHQSERTTALRYFKQAARIGDDEVANRWALRYYLSGGTEKGAEQSMAALNPAAMMSQEKLGLFLSRQGPAGQERWQRAINYWQETYGDLRPPPRETFTAEQLGIPTSEVAAEIGKVAESAKDAFGGFAREQSKRRDPFSPEKERARREELAERKREAYNPLLAALDHAALHSQTSESEIRKALERAGFQKSEIDRLLKGELP